jgi:hypothetical protein
LEVPAKEELGSRTKESKAAVGMFEIGLKAYSAQFPGLKECPERYRQYVEERTERTAQVISAGLVDIAPAVCAIGRWFAEGGVDLTFCYAGAYAARSQVLPVVQEAKAPAVVLNLQPTAALTARTPTRGVAGELLGVLRSGDLVHFQMGVLGKMTRLLDLEFMEADCCASGVRTSRLWERLEVRTANLFPAASLPRVEVLLLPGGA